MKRKAEERVDRKTDEAAEKVVDAADPTTGAAAGGAAAAPADAAFGGAASGAAAPTRRASDSHPGERVWSNYFFVSCERVLFREDFSLDHVCDFPRRLAFAERNLPGGWTVWVIGGCSVLFDSSSISCCSILCPSGFTFSVRARPSVLCPIRVCSSGFDG